MRMLPDVPMAVEIPHSREIHRARRMATLNLTAKNYSTGPCSGSHNSCRLAPNHRTSRVPDPLRGAACLKDGTEREPGWRETAHGVGGAWVGMFRRIQEKPRHPRRRTVSRPVRRRPEGEGRRSPEPEYDLETGWHDRNGWLSLFEVLSINSRPPTELKGDLAQHRSHPFGVVADDTQQFITNQLPALHKATARTEDNTTLYSLFVKFQRSVLKQHQTSDHFRNLRQNNC